MKPRLLSDEQTDKLLPLEDEIEAYLKEPCPTPADQVLDILLSDEVKRAVAKTVVLSRKVSRAQAKLTIRQVVEMFNLMLQVKYDPMETAIYNRLSAMETVLEQLRAVGGEDEGCEDVP